MCSLMYIWRGNFKPESPLQMLPSRLGIPAHHRHPVECRPAPVSAQHTPSVAWLHGPVLALLASGGETLDHFAITSETDMLF